MDCGFILGFSGQANFQCWQTEEWSYSSIEAICSDIIPNHHR
jgi:hypothetical protein